MRKIFVMPIGEVDRNTLDSLVRAVRETCHCATEQGESISVPQNTYNARRRQYSSTRILKALETLKPATDDILLGVIDQDLYVPELNFVFGEADLLAHIAVIGLSRLRQEFYGFEPDPELFIERAAKEAIHELGHLKGLGHCPGPRCIMRFSNSLEETDMKEAKFCSHCRNKLIQLNQDQKGEARR